MAYLLARAAMNNLAWGIIRISELLDSLGYG